MLRVEVQDQAEGDCDDDVRARSRIEMHSGLVSRLSISHVAWHPIEARQLMRATQDLSQLQARVIHHEASQQRPSDA